MADEKRITIVAYRLDPELVRMPLDFHILRFPESWKARLLDLQREVSGRRNDGVSIPVWSLNAALRALVPDLVAISKDAARTGERAWLISNEVIDANALHIIVAAWLRSGFADASPTSRQRALDAMHADDLVWTAEQIDVAAAETLPNGTANPHTHTYNVLPNYLAWSIETASTPVICGDETLHFRRVALEPGTSGAELVSWPPIRGGKESYYGYFSFTIRLTVQTVPFQSYPVLYTHLGIRRWVSRRTPLPKGNTSVVLLTQVPWLRGLTASNSLQGASVRWLPPQNGEFRLSWADNLASILNSLQFDQFPDPNELTENPEKWLRRPDGVIAGIVYSEGMKPQHAVGAGVSADERRKLVEQLNHILEPRGYYPVEPLPQARAVNSSVRNPFFPKDTERRREESDVEFKQRKQNERRCLIGNATQRRLDLEIYYQGRNVLHALQETLREMFGPRVETENEIQWSTDALQLRVRARHLGSLGRPLDIQGGRRNESDQIQNAMRSRIDEVATLLADPADRRCGAIIELSGADAFSKPNEDPKVALRAAFSAVGRVSQFITPLVDGESHERLFHRANASWLDLFRHLGVRLEEPDIEALGLSKAVRIVGIWLIKRTKSNSPTKREGWLPVAVCIDSHDSVVYAKVNGLDGFYTYPDALIAIGRGEAQFLDDERKAVFFIREMLDELKGAGDTLVLCDKQNLSRIWPWLYNSRIEQDRVSFANQQSIPITEFPGVRIIRVRSEASNYETPEWYQTKDKETKLPRGLWRISERVFGSTYGKPAQAQKVSQYTSKTGTWTNSKGNSFSPRPQVSVPNPAFYELTAACLQPDDDPVSWAALAHVLRNTSLHYGEAAARPNPLLLAERMEEYAFPFDATLSLPRSLRASTGYASLTANS
jgi:hypothetical protein